MGLFSLVGRAAVQDLLKQSTGKVPPESDVGFYFGVVIALFLVGAATGVCCSVGWVTGSVGCGRCR